MKASLCYHNRQVGFTAVWQTDLRVDRECPLISSIEQVKEFGISQSGLADDAFDDVLRQSQTARGWAPYRGRAFRGALGERGSLTARVSKNRLSAKRESPRAAQASEFWRHPGLDRNS